MIPTMILLGLVLGRWWWAALIAAGVGWPALLLGSDLIGPGQVPEATALALLNAAVGVALVQGALRIHRAGSGSGGEPQRRRRPGPDAPSGPAGVRALQARRRDAPTSKRERHRDRR